MASESDPGPISGPRPVVIDRAGNLHEADGTPIPAERTGLGPGAVLAGLADLEAGRVVGLGGAADVQAG